MKLLALPAALAFAALALPLPAGATDGYFPPGYGMKGVGRGGASTAAADDAFGGANNPATMVFAGNRIDGGITAFGPSRSASRSGLGPGLDGTSVSGSTLFGIPEFGYNRMLTSRVSLGVTLYGNGGMNTNYPGGAFNCGAGPANMLCGSGALGVNLVQIVVAPTLAVKLGRTQSIGIAPLFAYQQFAAQGLQAFTAISSDPAHVTNTGADSSTGTGVRIGWFARLGAGVDVGASYSTKLAMTRFAKYAGLFAGAGRFDVPENWSVGVALHALPRLTLLADYQRIDYAGVPAVGDPSTTPAPLGSADGPGFGWQNVGVTKLGVELAAGGGWTLRAGYNHGTNPILPRDVTFNILAPGVITDHLTAGATYRAAGGTEVTVTLLHAPVQSVSGASLLPAFLGGAPAGTETIRMHQNAVGIAVGHTL